ncbi:hypothetical protein [Mucilaginibacter sp. L3T2-6]|uniref:hypothetical protein n=1 Tax=Mucilaginibacter sp. L3T2-6 TaxID=3062491 RepID=UPI002675FFEF|nr:hypothetical protein [Mucilaginibacter sp. L3T2-6]MDO3640601.1 hypothetical protein [Mucilaginibacter sp. L3T2-6]MDV6213060.1 hypothetical protein [Mucilaginibacter sp. L3T2-6]
MLLTSFSAFLKNLSSFFWNILTIWTMRMATALNITISLKNGHTDCRYLAGNTYREKHFNEEWVIFVTTDHGRSEDNGRNHGGQSKRRIIRLKKG